MGIAESFEFFEREVRSRLTERIADRRRNWNGSVGPHNIIRFRRDQELIEQRRDRYLQVRQIHFGLLRRAQFELRRVSHYANNGVRRDHSRVLATEFEPLTDHFLSRKVLLRE